MSPMHVRLNNSSIVLFCEVVGAGHGFEFGGIEFLQSSSVVLFSRNVGGVVEVGFRDSSADSQILDRKSVV